MFALPTTPTRGYKGAGPWSPFGGGGMDGWIIPRFPAGFRDGHAWTPGGQAPCWVPPGVTQDFLRAPSRSPLSHPPETSCKHYSHHSPMQVGTDHTLTRTDALTHAPAPHNIHSRMSFVSCTLALSPPLLPAPCRSFPILYPASLLRPAHKLRKIRHAQETAVSDASPSG